MNRASQIGSWVTAWTLVLGAISLALIDDLLMIRISWFLVALFFMVGIAIWLGVALFTIITVGVGLFRRAYPRNYLRIGAILTVGLITSPIAFERASGHHLFFKLNQERYQAAAEALVAGAIPNRGRDFILPEKYHGLSSGNRVWAYQRGDAIDIIFIRGGLAGEVYGYIYSSDGEAPPSEPEAQALSETNKNWYSGNNEGFSTAPIGYGEF